MVSRALQILAGVAAIFAACTRLEVVGGTPTAPLGEGGAAGEAQAGFGSVAGEAMSGSGGTNVTPGGAPSRGTFGLWPTYSASPQEREVAAVLAAVSSLSAGSLSLPLHERWDELSGATGTPRTVTWRRLDAMVAPYRERQGNVALCIDVVDRALPAWPFTDELDSEAARGALRSTVNDVFMRYAGQLSLLCFGYQPDIYLSHAAPEQQAALVNFLSFAVDYAERHPQRSRERTAVGVALSLRALEEVPPELGDLAEQGDAVVAVYDPLDATDTLKEPGSIATELEQLVRAVAEREAAPRPIILLEAGYPSARAAGSSEQAQLEYVTSLLEALERTPGSVESAFLNGLSDRNAEACAAEALSFYPPNGPEAPEEALAEALSARAVLRCSMGLRAENAVPKLAAGAALRALLRE